MIVYHVTDARQADAIELRGFPDHTGDFVCSSQELGGVWISDRPVMDLAPVPDPVVFEMDVPDDVLSGCEVIEQGRDYREWLVSGSSLNRLRRRRVAWSEAFCAASRRSPGDEAL